MKKKIFLFTALAASLLLTVGVHSNVFSTKLTKASQDDVIHTIIFFELPPLNH